MTRGLLNIKKALEAFAYYEENTVVKQEKAPETDPDSSAEIYYTLYYDDPIKCETEKVRRLKSALQKGVAGAITESCVWR